MHIDDKSIKQTVFYVNIVRGNHMPNSQCFIGTVIYAVKSWPLLRHSQRVKIMYANYLEIILIAYLKFRKRYIDHYYPVLLGIFSSFVRM